MILLLLLLLANPAYALDSTTTAVRSVLPDIQRANDNAAKGYFPSSLLSSTYQSDAAGAAYYYRKASGQPDKIIVYLHTWSGDKTELVSNYPNVSAFTNTVVVAPDFGGANNDTYAQSDAAIDEIKTVIDEIKYKTGLSRVYLLGVSGGATTALNFMGRYPGVVTRASIWFPVYNLAQWYLDLPSNDPIRTNLSTIFGHAPANSSDADYLDRSPKNRLVGLYGPTKIFINTATSDTNSPPAYGVAAKDKIIAECPDCTVIYKEWSGGHDFTTHDMDAMKQLVLE